MTAGAGDLGVSIAIHPERSSRFLGFVFSAATSKRKKNTSMMLSVNFNENGLLPFVRRQPNSFQNQN